MPHPSDNKLNLRIQTTGASAASILVEGLNNLIARCDHIMDQFQTQLDANKYELVEPEEE
jgi:DNA-directed RNA polymerase I and III subunit RPAC2